MSIDWIASTTVVLSNLLIGYKKTRVIAAILALFSAILWGIWSFNQSVPLFSIQIMFFVINLNNLRLFIKENKNERF